MWNINKAIKHKYIILNIIIKRYTITCFIIYIKKVIIEEDSETCLLLDILVK